MSKIYFLDSGFRNAILKQFDGLNRIDADGMLLEANVFTEMVKNG